MLLIRIHCARSVRLLSLGTSITICICARPVGKRLVPNHQTIIFVRAIFQGYMWLTPNKFYRECHPKVLSVYTCSWHGSLRVSQGIKIHFYQTWKLIFTTLEFYRECRPSTRSWHGSLRVSQGRKIHFYQTWKLIFTTLEFYRECRPIK